MQPGQEMTRLKGSCVRCTDYNRCDSFCCIGPPVRHDNRLPPSSLDWPQAGDAALVYAFPLAPSKGPSWVMRRLLQDISKAAERYKEMLKEVKGNVERMKVLEVGPESLAQPTLGGVFKITCWVHVFVFIDSVYVPCLHLSWDLGCLEPSSLN